MSLTRWMAANKPLLEKLSKAQGLSGKLPLLESLHEKNPHKKFISSQYITAYLETAETSKDDLKALAKFHRTTKNTYV